MGIKSSIIFARIIASLHPDREFVPLLESEPMGTRPRPSDLRLVIGAVFHELVVVSCHTEISAIAPRSQANIIVTPVAAAPVHDPS